jgi:hypothetical protein
MSAFIYVLPPRCPACHRPMHLVHFLQNPHVRTPVRSYECQSCHTDAILQSQPTSAELVTSN